MSATFDCLNWLFNWHERYVWLLNVRLTFCYEMAVAARASVRTAFFSLMMIEVLLLHKEALFFLVDMPCDLRTFGVTSTRRSVPSQIPYFLCRFVNHFLFGGTENDIAMTVRWLMWSKFTAGHQVWVPIRCSVISGHVTLLQLRHV